MNGDPVQCLDTFDRQQWEVTQYMNQTVRQLCA